MQAPSFRVEQPIVPEDETSAPKKRRNIVTPWQNLAEFEDVRNYIYGMNSNPTTWKQAIVELRIWTNRRRSQCPAAVFATLTMLEAKLHEENKHFEESELQSLFAFALIRFFNFMSSTIQTYNMRSMYTTATELGLASFVVDLRHICAHGSELPELLVLRQTINYCLNWLYGYYWSIQTEKMVDADSKCLQQRDKILNQRTQEVEDLLKIFDTAFECHLNACSTAKDVKNRIRGQRLTKIKNFWKAKNISSVRETFDAVLSDMIALTKCGTSQKNLSAIFAKSLIKINYFFSFVDDHNIEHELPDILEVVQNLFRFFAVYNIIESVLCQLFYFAENAQTPLTQRVGAAFWAKQIVIGMSVFVACKKKFFASCKEGSTKIKFDHNNINFGQLSKNIRHTYKTYNVDLERTIIFGDSFQRPWVWSFNRTFLQKRVKAINDQTAPVLENLITLIKPKMSSQEIDKLNKIVSLYLGQSDSASEITAENENDSSDKIFTTKDISGNLVSNQTDHGEESLSKESTELPGWKLLQEDEYDWSNCPIGRVPWQ